MRKKTKWLIPLLFLLLCLIIIPITFSKYVTSINQNITLNAHQPEYDVVFSPNISNLPSTYTELEYIESDGTQYIDTGLYGHMSYKYELSYQQANSECLRLWGAFGQDSYIGKNMSITWAAPTNNVCTQILRWEHEANTQRSASLGVINTNRHTIIIDNGDITYDGLSKTKSQGHQDNFIIDANLYLFNINNYNASVNLDYGFVGKIHSYKVWDDNDDLIQNFIPCFRNSDGVVGLYEKINGVFYTNANATGNDFKIGKTQHFVYGTAQNLLVNDYTKDNYKFINWNTLPNGTGTSYDDEELVNNLTTIDNDKIVLYAQWQGIEYDGYFNYLLPNEYQELEYIEGTGTQYILTGVIPDNNTGIYVKLKNNQSSTNAVYFGSGNHYTGLNSQSGFWIGHTESRLYARWNQLLNANIFESGSTINNNDIIELYLNYLNDRAIKYNNNILIKDLSELGSLTIQISIYGFNNDMGEGTNVVYNDSYKLYEFRITQDDAVIRSYVPCYRKSDNVTGLYDMVTKTFYVNQGTGEFTRGSEVPNDYHVVKTQRFVYDTAQNLLPNTYIRDGYTFDSWNTLPAGTGESYQDEEEVINLASNEGDAVNLYSQWTPNEYTVYFHPNRSNLPDTYTELDYIESDGTQYIDLNNTAKPDQRFEVKAYTSVQGREMAIIGPQSGIGFIEIGLNSNDKLLNYSASGNVITLSPTTTLYDREFSFKASINSNAPYRELWLDDGGYSSGGTSWGGKNLSLRVLAMGDGRFPFIGRLYYLRIYENDVLSNDLIPCFRNSDGVAGLYDTINDIFYTNSNPEGNDFVQGYVSQDFVYDVEDDLITNTYTNDGYSFVNWNTLPDGTGTSYQDEQVVKNLTGVHDEKVKLYAQWGKNLIVTFDPNTGTVSPTSKSAVEKLPYGNLPIPTKPGYTFLGWNGKNIFDFGTSDDYWTSIEMTIDSNEKSISAIKTNNWSGDYWRNEKNQYGSGTYTLSATFSGQTGPIHIIFLYDSNGNIIDNSNLSISGFTWNSYYNGWYSNRPNVTVTIPSSVSYWKYGSAFTGAADTSAKISDIMVQNGNVASVYEPYYVTEDTIVTQTEDHTLTANWKVNEYSVVFYPNRSRVPSGYTELEYIESTGTQYIDTGVLGDNSNLSFDVKYKTPSGNVTGYVYGSYVDDNKSITRLLIYNENQEYFEINSKVIGAGNISHSPDTIYTESISRNGNTITYTSNGNTVNRTAVMPTTQSSNILIFSRNGLNFSYKMKLYYFKIYDNGVLIRDFIPSVRNSDGVAGLYDTINDVFYPNANNEGDDFVKGKSQDFVYGTAQDLIANTYTRDGYTFDSWNTLPDGTGTSYQDEEEVMNLTLTDGEEIKLYAQWTIDEYEVVFSPNRSNLPNGYTELNYIESDGTQYIDTGFTPNQDTRMVVDFELVDGYRIFGAESRSSSSSASSSSQSFRFGRSLQNMWFFAYGNQGLRSTGTFNSNRHLFEINKNKIYLDNTLISTYTYAPFTSYGNAYLLQINNNYFNVEADGSQGKLYGAKIYDNNVLVRNFIPCFRNSDGVAGLYDVINDVFYSNSNNAGNNFGKGYVSQSIEHDAEDDLTANTYTRNGYTFDGWNTLPDGTGTSYSDEETVINLTTTEPQVVLYAMWTIDQYKVMFSPNRANLPSGYTEVDYIESNGTQYIDTGYQPNNNTKIHLVTSFNSLSSNASNTVAAIYGSRTTRTNNNNVVDAFGAWLFEEKFRFDYGSSMKNDGYGAETNLIYDIWHSGEYYEINGDRYNTNLTGNFTSSATLTLFSNKEYTSSSEYVLTDNSADTRYSSAKVYLMEIYDEDDLVRNLIPCFRNSDGVVGLYDTINDIFYTNEVGDDLEAGYNSQTLEHNESNDLIANTYTRSGYVFNSWNTLPDGTGESYEDEEEVENLTLTLPQVVLYAQWDRQVRVTFNANGGTSSESTRDVLVGKPYGTLPTPTKTGYTFLGWNGKNKFNIDDFMETYGQYQTNAPAKVTFEGEEVWKMYGQVPNEVITYKYMEGELKENTKYTLSTSFYPIAVTYTDGKDYNGPLIRIYDENDTGYEYVGDACISRWYNRSYTHNISYFRYTYGVGSAYTYFKYIQLEEGTEATEYEPYYVTSSTNVTQNNDHTLTAIYRPNTYEVAFDANEPEGETATGSMANQEFTYDVTDSLTTNAYQINDYIFDGWNTLPDGSGEGYADEEDVMNLTSVDGDEIVLYAQWRSTKSTITLRAGYGISNMSYSDKSGSLINIISDNGDIIDLSAITKTYTGDFSGTKYYIKNGGNLTEINGTTYTVGDSDVTILVDPASPNKCYCNNGTQTQGTTCNIGVFTYRYKGKMGTNGSWSNITNNGWGVALTDRNATTPVTETMCAYVNDEPIVSTQYMFYNSEATSIDVTNYYTKNTELFIGMFDSSKATEIIGLSNLDVSKATSLFRVFRNMTNITVLDLTGWDTTATNFGNMFNGDSSLRTIYASNKFVIPNGATTTSMFGNCGNLKGGAGTPYDATYVTGVRAKIDGGAGDEGYFTLGPPPSTP